MTLNTLQATQPKKISLFKGNSLGDLYEKDTQNAKHAFLYAYPSTASYETFPNNEKFVIHDGAKDKVPFTSVHQKEPWRHMAVMGDKIPSILTSMPNALLMEALQEQFQLSYNIHFLNHENYCNDINNSELYEKVLTLFPYDHILEEKHAVNPHKHYHLLDKTSLQNLDVPTPHKEFFSTTNWENFSKMVEKIYLEKKKIVLKTTHSLSGDGTFIITNGHELKIAMEKLYSYMLEGVESIICEEFIEVEQNNVLSFYVDKEGNITYIGNGKQVTDKEGHFLGGEVDYENFQVDKYLDIMENTAKYLHENEYFGYASLDILEDKEGKLFVIDGNFRLIGSTSLYVMQNLLKKHGVSNAFFSTEFQYEGSLHQFLSSFRKEMSSKMFQIVSALENNGKTDIYGIITGISKDHLEKNKQHCAAKNLNLNI